MMNVTHNVDPYSYHVEELATQTLKNKDVKGTGKQLIQYLIKDARKNKIEYISLSPILGSRNFYLKMGFKPCPGDPQNDLYYFVSKKSSCKKLRI